MIDRAIKAKMNTELSFPALEALKQLIIDWGFYDAIDRNGNLIMTVPQREEIAWKLSRAIGKLPPYGHRAILNTITGQIPVSKRMAKAIEKLCMTEDGMSSVEIEAHPTPSSMLTVKPLPPRCINLVSAKRCTVCGLGYTCYPAQKWCPRCGGALEKWES